jgi:hypothetical protein
VSEKTSKSSKLDRQKEQAIAALLAKPTIEEAAAAAGIGYATLRRWLQDPGFASEYRRARRDLVSQVAAQLQSAAGEAVSALVAIVRDAEAPGLSSSLWRQNDLGIHRPRSRDRGPNGSHRDAGAGSRGAGWKKYSSGVVR